MKRRVAILRAILAPTDIILMDEPFTGLDADTRQLDRSGQRVLCRKAPDHCYPFGGCCRRASGGEDHSLIKPENHFNWLLTSQPYHPICQSLTTIYEKNVPRVIACDNLHLRASASFKKRSPVRSSHQQISLRKTLLLIYALCRQ